MLKRIWRGFLWDKVLNHARQEDFSASLDKLGQMDAIEPLRPYERAIRATLLLRNTDYVAAEAELRSVVAELKSEISPNKVYTRLYCQYVLATIEGDLDHKRALREQALALKTSSGLRRWLPL